MFPVVFIGVNVFHMVFKGVNVFAVVFVLKVFKMLICFMWRLKCI